MSNKLFSKTKKRGWILLCSRETRMNKEIEFDGDKWL